jgi:hypothetical protein
MIGKEVKIKKDGIETNVVIVDKIMTNLALYSKSAVINNASFEVYVGFINSHSEDNDTLIQFKVEDILKIY